MTRRSRSGELSGLASLAVPRRGAHASRRRSGMGLPRRGLLVPLLGVVVVAAAVFAGVQLLRPAPTVAVQASATAWTVPGAPAHLAWPGQGAAALAVAGSGMVATSGSAAPVPIASITKVMTALVVLADHPLTTGQSGPTITVTPAEVAQYQADVAEQQSVVAVVAGEKLTERQALQAMLVPSGNNIARMLATWDRSSTASFVAAMNARANALGMTHTHFAGPSGLNPGSVSTPGDLVLLGEAAEANPVIAAIVAMPSVTLPVAGTVYNYDYVLGKHGFVGIKTGSDGQAGGCFLFDAAVPVGTATGATAAGGTVQVIGAVVGQQATPIITSALNAAVALVGSFGPQLGLRPVIAAGQRFGTLRAPWGASAPIVAQRPLDATGWAGMRLKGSVRVSRLGTSVRRGQRVGTLSLAVGGTTHHVALVAGAAVGGPSARWRLTHL